MLSNQQILFLFDPHSFLWDEMPSGSTMDSAVYRRVTQCRFYEQAIRVNASIMVTDQCFLCLLDSMRVLLGMDWDQRPTVTPTDYMRFISLFGDDGDYGTAKRFDVCRVYQFVSNLAMHRFGRHCLSLFLDQLIGVCLDASSNGNRCEYESDSIWSATERVFAKHWVISDHLESGSNHICSLDIHALSDPQILFLFHPHSFLWNHPKIKFPKMFKFKLDARRGGVLGEIHRNYALNIHHLRDRKGVMSLLVLNGSSTRILRISRNRYWGQLNVYSMK